MQQRTSIRLALFLAVCTHGLTGSTTGPERPQPAGTPELVKQAVDPKLTLERQQWENAESYFIIAPRLQQHAETTKWLQLAGSLFRLTTDTVVAVAATYGMYRLLTNQPRIEQIVNLFEMGRAKLPPTLQFRPATTPVSAPQTNTTSQGASTATEVNQTANPITAAATMPTGRYLWLPVIAAGLITHATLHTLQGWLFAKLERDRAIDLAVIELAINRSAHQSFSDEFPPQIKKILRHIFYEREISPDRELAILREIRMLIEEYYARTPLTQ